MRYIFDATGPRMTMVKAQIIEAKNIKISNELQKSYIPQKKAQNMYNRDSARKK